MLPQTQNRADCVRAVNAKYAGLINSAKSNLDSVATRSTGSIWWEGFNNNIVADAQVAAVNGVLSAAAWAWGVKAESGSARTLVLPGSAAVTRWVPAPSKMGVAAQGVGKFLGGVAAVGLLGQMWSGTMNVLGHDMYAVPQALDQFNSEMSRLNAAYQSEIAKCK